MYEKLILKAEEAGIGVVEKNMRDSFKGLYSDNAILINSNLSDTEKACIMAEELGHHFTTVGNILDQSKIINRKQETLARRWGYEKRIPLEDIAKAIKDCCRSIYDISEYLNIPEWYIEEAIEFYNCKYGMYATVDGVNICFNPFGTLTMFED